MLDAGQTDDYNRDWGRRLLSHRLTEVGIAHVASENAGNHGGRASESYQVALEWMGQVLRRGRVSRLGCDGQPVAITGALCQPVGTIL